MLIAITKGLEVGPDGVVLDASAAAAPLGVVPGYRISTPEVGALVAALGFPVYLAWRGRKRA